MPTKVAGDKKLKFSLKKYFAEISNILKMSSRNDWYKKSRGKYDLLQTSFYLAKELELRRFYYPLWLKRFSYLIPARWEYWRNICFDFEKAKETNVQLDSTLIDAAIMHPLFVVAERVAVCQKLNAHQLSWLLTRPYFSGNKVAKDNVLLAQRGFSVEDKTIDKALSISTRIGEKLQKWYKRNNFSSINETTDSLLKQDLSSLTYTTSLLEKMKDKNLDKKTKNEYLQTIKSTLAGNPMAIPIVAALISRDYEGIQNIIEEIIYFISITV